MAEDKLMFPVGFDVDSGVNDAIKEWNKAQQRLTQAIGNKPIKVQIVTDKNSMTELEQASKKATSTAEQGMKKSGLAADSYKAKLRELTIQWNNLTAAQRGGIEGNKIIAQYKALNAEAKGMTGTISAAAKMQDKQAASTKNATSAIHGQNAAYKTQLGYVDRLVTRLGVYGLIFGGLRMIDNIRSTTAEFELQKVALGAIIQDADKAAQLFAQIKAAAVQSPFEIKDLVSYTKQLSAYRIETEKLFEWTMRLADVSAGLAIPMERLVLAFGQIRAAGVLRGQEVRQLTEAGIPVIQLLAEKFSKLRGEMVSTAEVFELISDRAVSFKMVEEIFTDMTDAGGMFYQMQKKQAQTLAGEWSNLKDAISIAYDEMGRDVYGAMRGGVGLLREMIKNWETIANVTRIAATGLLLYKAGQIGLISIAKIQNANKIAEIRLDKAREAGKLRYIQISRVLNETELASIANRKKLTAEDYKRFFTERQLTESQMLRLVSQKRNNAELLQGIVLSGKMTQEQISQITSMKKWQVTLKSLGVSMQNLGTNIGRIFRGIGASIAAFAPIAAITTIITLLSEWMMSSRRISEAQKEVTKVYEDKLLELTRIENEFNLVSREIALANDEDGKFAKAGYGNKIAQLMKLRDILAKYNLGTTIDFDEVNYDNIDEIFKNWVTLLKDVNTLSADWGYELARVNNAFEGTILGWSIFGENLKEDMEDLADSWYKLTTDTKFSRGLDQMRTSVDTLFNTQKEYYNELSRMLGLDAKLAISGKRRNESEYEYQMRILDVYQKISFFFRSSEATKMGGIPFTVFPDISMKRQDFMADLGEVMQEIEKTTGKLMKESPMKIRMVIDEQFTKNEWAEWQRDAVIAEINKKRLKAGLELIPTYTEKSIGQSVKAIKSIIKATSPTLFTEDEFVNMGNLQSIYSAINEKVETAKKNVEALKVAQNNVADGSKEYENNLSLIKKLQEEINSEKLKDAKDIDSILIANNEARIQAIINQNKAYDEQIIKAKEVAQAELDAAEAAQKRVMSSVLSPVALDVKIALPELFTDEELAKIKTVEDLYDAWASKTKEVEEAKKKMQDVGIKQIYIDEEQAKIDDKKAETQQKLLDIEYQIATNKILELDAEIEKLKIALMNTTSDKERTRIQGRLNEIYASETYQLGLQLKLQKDNLAHDLLRLNAVGLAQANVEEYINSLPTLTENLSKLQERYNFKSMDKGRKGGEDPWIVLMKNRAKFMADFNQGYEELNKVMAANNSLMQEQNIMAARGASLKIDVDTLTGSREELSNWYDEAIKLVQNKIKKIGGKEFQDLTVEAILRKDTKNLKAKKYQDLLQELFNLQTDFDTKILSDKIKKELDQLATEIERSQAAQGFYDKILGLRGDKELAMTLTMSIYGDMGADVGQKIIEQFSKSLEKVKGIDLNKFIKTDGTIDLPALQKALDLIEAADEGTIEQINNVQKLIKEQQKAIGDELINLYTNLGKFEDYEIKRLAITRQRIKDETDAERLGRDQIEKDYLKGLAKEKETKSLQQLDYSKFKESDLYIKMFDNLEKVSTKTLERMKQKLIEMQSSFKDLDPTQLREMQSRLNAIEKEQTVRNPFKVLVNSIKDYRAELKRADQETREANLLAALSTEDEARIVLRMQQEIVDMVSEQYVDAVKLHGVESEITKEIEARLDAEKKILKLRQNELNKAEQSTEQASEEVDKFAKIKTAISNASIEIDKYQASINAAADGIREMMDLWGSTDEEKEYFDTLIEGFNQTLDGVQSLATGVMSGNPVQIISGVFNAVIGISKLWTAGKIKRANEEIKRQQKILDSLSYTYGRLQKAAEDALGVDYIQNYNQQLDNLADQQIATQKQLQAEKDKGKKADQKAIEDYEKQIRELKDQQEDMKKAFAAGIAGTDITSLAKELVSVWIEARKAGEDTMSALGKKYKDLMKEIAANTLLNKAMQVILKPVFDQLDELREDSAKMYDQKWWQNLDEVMNEAMINGDVAMENIYKMLQKFGINMRDTSGNLSGISKEIAGASEEAILGLAAGINTQNFYISGMYNIQTEILNIMRQSSISGGGQSLTDVLTLQNTYFQNLPKIEANTAQTVAECRLILAEVKRSADNFDRVVKPVGVKGGYAVNTQLN